MNSLMKYPLIAITSCLLGCSSTAPEPKSTHPDFSGVWVITEYDEVIRPEEVAQYTPEALEIEQFYKENFDVKSESHSMFCDTTGMPWTMLGRARNYPREIYQAEDRIVFSNEYMDQIRHIHLNQTAFPDYIPPTRQGYSIGHWEGDELIIESKGFTMTSDATLYHRSDEATITERWKLQNHPSYGEVIEITLTMTDPYYYKEPVQGRTLIKRAAEGVMLGQYGCAATLWEDFIDKRRDSIE